MKKQSDIIVMTAEEMERLRVRGVWRRAHPPLSEAEIDEILSVKEHKVLIRIEKAGK